MQYQWTPKTVEFLNGGAALWGENFAQAIEDPYGVEVESDIESLSQIEAIDQIVRLEGLLNQTASGSSGN
jgi:hypothetical protein